MEHDSFEIQIHEIDKELSKFDRLDEVNLVAEVKEFDLHPNTNPKNLIIGEKVGELNSKSPGPLAESTSTLSLSTTSQINPILRKWKQLARQANVGDSSM